MSASRPGPEKEFSVRPYQESDRDDLIALWHNCGLLVWYNDPKADLALWQSTASARVLVGHKGKRLVTSCCVCHDGHRGWFYYVATCPTQRGKGLGRQIMRAGESWLRHSGIHKAQLMVRPSNKAVECFYQALGYEREERLVLSRWLVDRGEPPDGEGQITTTITYLEMKGRPEQPPAPAPRLKRLALLRAERPSVAFYRYLYNTVGERWLWYERRAMKDEALARILEDELVELYVLYVGGVPAGFAELDRRRPPDIELAYFGLMPDFIGAGLGRYLLSAIIDIAWNHQPERLWVHTNSLDHPRALAVYQRCGFRPFRQEKVRFFDPRTLGLFS